MQYYTVAFEEYFYWTRLKDKFLIITVKTDGFLDFLKLYVSNFCCSDMLENFLKHLLLFYFQVKFYQKVEDLKNYY